MFSDHLIPHQEEAENEPDQYRITSINSSNNNNNSKDKKKKKSRPLINTLNAVNPIAAGSALTQNDRVDRYTPEKLEEMKKNAMNYIPPSKQAIAADSEIMLGTYIRVLLSGNFFILPRPQSISRSLSRSLIEGSHHFTKRELHHFTETFCSIPR